MQTLSNTLKLFDSTLGHGDRKAFDFKGIVYSDKDGAINYPSSLPSSDDLLSFYKHFSFHSSSAVGGSLYLSFSSLEKLEDAQSGWRWVNGGENDKWNKSHVVIANRHGDALIADTASSNTPIFGRVPAGEAFEVAGSLNLFFATLTKCMIAELEEFSMETYDEDEGEYNQQFILRVGEIASELLSPDAAEGFVYYFFG
jgi:hypothetical protein